MKKEVCGDEGLVFTFVMMSRLMMMGSSSVRLLVSCLNFDLSCSKNSFVVHFLHVGLCFVMLDRTITTSIFQNLGKP